MAVQVMDPRRPAWERRADEPERLRQMGTGATGYIAYAGRFDVEEDPVPPSCTTSSSTSSRTGSAARSGGRPCLRSTAST